MANLREAKGRALRHISQLYPDVAPDVQIIHEMTIEEGAFFVFFYNLRRYLEERNPGFMLCGNAPLIVSRTTAGVFETGTDKPIEHYIQKFKEGSL